MLKTSAGVSSLAFLIQNTLFAKNSSFKIGACDWSLWQTGRPEAFDIAKKVGLNGVQVSLNTKEDEFLLRAADKRKIFKEKAKSVNLEFSGLAIGLLNDVPFKSEKRTEEWVADSILAAKDLNVKNVLLAFFSKNDLKKDPKSFDVVIQKLKNIAPFAEKNGIVLGIESWLSAVEHMYIIDAVGSDAVKVYYDVCNSNVMGYDIYEELKWLGKKNMICEVHCKENGVLLGKGPVDFMKVKESLDDFEYSGWLQIEGALPEKARPEEVYGQNLEHLRKFF
jgi:sugar phosphate isomerase/epimerase